MPNLFSLCRSQDRKPLPTFDKSQFFSVAPFVALMLGVVIAGSLFLHAQQNQTLQSQVEQRRVLPIP